MFMEMSAYVGDVLSFYTDTQLNGYIQSRRNHQHIEWFEKAAEKE